MNTTMHIFQDIQIRKEFKS